MKPGPPKYADFAKSVPPQNPFTPASTHGGTSQRNISQYNNACSGSQICGDFAQPNSVHHYYHYPTIAPAAAAPPAATAPAAAPPAASAPAASAATATAPVAAPAATAPPSSEAQQLAHGHRRHAALNLTIAALAATTIAGLLLRLARR